MFATLVFASSTLGNEEAKMRRKKDKRILGIGDEERIVVAMLLEMRADMKHAFGQIDRGFKKISWRFLRMERQFDRLEDHLDAIWRSGRRSALGRQGGRNDFFQ